MIVTGLTIVFLSAVDAIFGTIAHAPGLGILVGLCAITGTGGFVMLSQGLGDAGDNLMSACRASCRRL